MNRRNFLKLVSAVPFVGLIPVKKASAVKVVIHTPHSLSLEYPRNLGLVVCKNFGDVITSISKFAKHPDVKAISYSRFVEYSNGSRVVFQTAGEIACCTNLNLGWVAIDRDIKNPELIQRLRCRLRRKGVPYHWFRFTNETLLSGCECKGTGRLWLQRTATQDLSVRSCDCEAGVQRDKRLHAI